MQLKLLNFHKILSQFASNIVGAFIALIIYQSTNSFSYAFLFLVLNMVLRIIFSRIFFKAMERKPQVFLAIRLFPFLFYSLSILLLDTHLKVLGIILAVIFHSLAVTFKDMPMELIFSYSSLNKGASSNGLSRLFEYIGVISAIIIGGLFLDNLPKWVAIAIACGSYLISVIPLLVYYFKQKNSKTFNQDAISNAVESFEKIKIKKRQKNVITKKLLVRYFLIYFAFCVYDALMQLLSLYLFKVSAESYSFTSYIQASFYALFGLGCFIAGKLEDNIDLTNIVSICCIVSGAVVCLVPFVAQIIWLEVLLFGVIGFLYSFISIFCYSRMMTRCKIMGVSNLALQGRAQASRYSQILIFGIGAIGPFMFIPAFIITGVIFASCAIFIPKNEETTRQMLVDYLENNKLY